MRAGLASGWWLDADDKPWRFDGTSWFSPCSPDVPISVDDEALAVAMPLPIVPLAQYRDEALFSRSPAPIRDGKRTPMPRVAMIRSDDRLQLSIGVVEWMAPKRALRIQVDDARHAIALQPADFVPGETVRLMPLPSGAAAVPAKGLAARIGLAVFDRLDLHEADGRLIGRAS